MFVEELMKEYGLEVDDVRWFLANRKAGELMEFKEHLPDLIQFIWSKGLEDSLYNMEERFVEDLQDQYQRGFIDETFLREICLETLTLRRKRF